MPVSTVACADAPKSAATDRNITSTAGRQEFSGGALLSWVTVAPPRRAKIRCRSPGAM